MGGRPMPEVWQFCHIRELPSGSKLIGHKHLQRSLLTHEQTIRAAAACSGVGLHSGAPVSLRILPAPAGTGIVFRRTDLDGFEIEASGRDNLVE